MNTFPFSKVPMPLSVLATVALVLSSLGSPVAVADDVNAKQDTTEIPVGLADATFIALPVVTTSRRELIIHYSAECRSDDGFVEYDIFVDSTEIAPTHDNWSALCSAPAAPATVGMTVMHKVDPGNHVVRVRGRIDRLRSRSCRRSIAGRRGGRALRSNRCKWALSLSPWTNPRGLAGCAACGCLAAAARGRQVDVTSRRGFEGC